MNRPTPTTDDEIIEQRNADELNARILVDCLHWRAAVCAALPVDSFADRLIAASLRAALAVRPSRKLTRKAR